MTPQTRVKIFSLENNQVLKQLTGSQEIWRPLNIAWISHN